MVLLVSFKYARLYIITVILLLFIFPDIYSQTAQKPSGNYTIEKTDPKTSVGSLLEIKELADFEKLSRVYNKGSFSEIPHLLFMVDRKRDLVYYINTPKYEFHLYFINELLNREYTPHDLKPFYENKDRRFILGTISYQNTIKKYVYEFWEGDKVSSDLLKYAGEKINSTFFETVLFKTNATLHEEEAQKAAIDYITQEQLVKEFPYIVLNQGRSKGRIRIAASIEDISNIDEDDILVLKEVPISIPVVKGVISEKASTLLSHVNILARTLNIPSIYLKDAVEIMRKYDGKYVDFTADINNYTVKEIEEPKFVKSKRIKYSIKSDLSKTDLLPLETLRKKDYVYCGVKAANLGEINARIKDAAVPDGFAIPFSQYHAFIEQYKIKDKVEELQASEDFNASTDIRREKLEKLRNYIESCDVDTLFSNSWVKQWQNQLNSKGVFVRSSSNAEDLKNFSGAGLFSTIPNVRKEQDLVSAVKKVWASAYNFEAYESRRRMNIPDSLIMMSVFVQQATDSDISGVMITKDPYNPLRWDITYIAAKRGIGIRVVEGKRIAEQVMFSEKTRAVQVITRSEEDSELRLSNDGGVEEVPLTDNQRVMSDKLVVKLAHYGKQIKSLFKDNMDIEWAVSDDTIIILQARPYK